MEFPAAVLRLGAGLGARHQGCQRPSHEGSEDRRPGARRVWLLGFRSSGDALIGSRGWGRKAESSFRGEIEVLVCAEGKRPLLS